MSGLGRRWTAHIHSTHWHTSALLHWRGSPGSRGRATSPAPLLSPPRQYISTSSSVYTGAANQGMSRSLEHGTTWGRYNNITSHLPYYHPTLAPTCRFSMVPLSLCLCCISCQLWPVRGSAGDCDSLVAAAGVAQGGRGH